jgi:hypothetical protein
VSGGILSHVVQREGVVHLPQPSYLPTGGRLA